MESYELWNELLERSSAAGFESLTPVERTIARVNVFLCDFDNGGLSGFLCDDGALIGSTPVSLPRPTGDAPVQYQIAMRGHRDQLFSMNARTQTAVTLHLERERRSHARVEPDGRPGTATTVTTPPAEPREDTRRRSIDTLDDGIINPFDDPPRRRAR